MTHAHTFALAACLFLTGIAGAQDPPADLLESMDLDAMDSLWHLRPASMESILRDGTLESGNHFTPPGLDRDEHPHDAPVPDIPSPGGIVLVVIAGARAAMSRQRH